MTNFKQRRAIAILLFVANMYCATLAIALVDPEIESSSYPNWLIVLFTGHGKLDDSLPYCYGALIDPNWIVTVTGCLVDPYQILDYFSGDVEADTYAGLVNQDSLIKLGNPHFSADGELIYYQLSKPIANQPTVVSTLTAAELFGENIKIYGASSSQTFGDPFFSPDIKPYGECRINNKLFFTQGVMCYVLAQGAAPANLLSISGKIIDPSGDERPSSKIDDVITANVDGSETHIIFDKPGSFPCNEDLGMPIVRTLDNGQVQLIGLVNRAGMAAGTPICNASLINRYSLLSYYKTSLDRAKIEGSFESLCPKAPFVTLDYTNTGEAEVSWKPIVDATGYTVFFSTKPGIKAIQNLDIGNKTRVKARIPAGAVYEVAVQATGYNCTSSLSNRLSVTPL